MCLDFKQKKQKNITNITGKYNMIKENTLKRRKQIDYIARHDRRLKYTYAPAYFKTSW